MTTAEVIDYPLIRVPLESLKRAAKDRKHIIDETREQLQEVVALADSKSREEHAQTLESLVMRLKGLKRKLNDCSKVERDDAHRSKARLEHLNATTSPNKDEIIAWNKNRLDRILVDHLLRCGYHNTACKLAEESNLNELVDIHIFLGAKHVVEALKVRDCSPALAWCADNQAKLKKIKSKLEFKLRLQEFIELVRNSQQLDAINYARSHLASWAQQDPAYMAEFQRAIATLVFSHTSASSSASNKYSSLFDLSQWDSLLELFYRELYRLHCLTSESLLTVHLQSGLSALKTPLSYQEGCSREDPLHLPAFQKLAEGLPFAKHVHSKLICYVTKELMDDANPPVVLPNDYVYSQKATELIMAKNNGRMVCPKSGESYPADELRRAFIA